MTAPRNIIFFLAATLMFCNAAADSVAQVKIDADFPGGNIIVEKIEGNSVYLHQDLRDTAGWWFYWNFRVNGAAGQTIRFHFTNKNVIGKQGPAISLDAGQTWSWLGTETVQAEDKGVSFAYSFAPDANSIRFAFAIPYQQADLKRFLSRYAKNKYLVVDELCKTPKGRSVERIRIGSLDARPQHLILLTSRHHACESAANYVLEGVMEAVLAQTDTAKWFQQKAEIVIIPFMDKDGVEDGDQGKNRKPRDHGRDYRDASIYSSTNALREFISNSSDKRRRIILDLHCPYIRGKESETVYLVGVPENRIWDQQCAFSRLLENICRNSLPFKSSDNIPFGQSWNTAENEKQGASLARWASQLETVRLSSSIEIPYSTAGSVIVTPGTARAFGADLVIAIRKYLEQK